MRARILMLFILLAMHLHCLSVAATASDRVPAWPQCLRYYSAEARRQFGDVESLGRSYSRGNL